jgi:hypothetical protein
MRRTIPSLVLAARRAAGLVRARVDSVPETRLRLCLVLAGLPTPDCNLVMGTHARPIGRVDLVFKEFGVLSRHHLCADDSRGVCAICRRNWLRRHSGDHERTLDDALG